MDGLQKTMRSKQNEMKKSGTIPHFRLLGLKRGECRIEVIRSAAQALSISLSTDEPHSLSDLADRRRARIAYATYRLLDPRGRRDLYERVQLSFPVDRDDQDQHAIARNMLVNKMPVLTVKAKIKGHIRAGSVRLMNQPLIDRAIDEDGIVTTHQETLEDRRRIVRLIQEPRDDTTKSLSPFGWLLGKLGL
jgi:hypothetical protein